ncbi:MAG: hypothetical protein AAGH15_26305, partial [Myxococcota bacterium]
RAERARAAGDAAGALAALAEHRRRFPEGQLAPEVAGTRAMVLCESGDARGAPAGRAFLARHGGTVLAGAVRRACAEADAP